MECFLPGKTIFIDAYGWGDLLLGVVIGAVKPPEHMMFERRIPTASFQPPNFKNKKYLEDSIKIANEIITVFQPASDVCIKICSEYILSGVTAYLIGLGYRVQKVESTGDLRPQVEKAYLRWCIEKGVPEELLRNKKRFWNILEWISEQPKTRESLVKTGWASWEHKWREEIFKTPFKANQTKNSAAENF